MSYTVEEAKKRFTELGEYYILGYFELPEASPFVRFSRAIRRHFECRPLTPYNGEPVYPCGPKDDTTCINYDHSHTILVQWRKLENEDAVLAQFLRDEMSDVFSVTKCVPYEHAVGGNMYTHSTINFRRVILEGLNSYKERIDKISDNDIRTGLTDVWEGIRTFHARCLAYLKDIPEAGRLYAALKKVPFEPADSLYEALVCLNFTYYIDGCDNIGRIDANLIDFYRGEDVTDILRCIFKNIDANNGWSGALGPDYNELTLQCLKAISGMRRPSLELRITPEMPQELWTAAAEAIACGGGSPSLYNENAYQNKLAEIFPDIPKEDLLKFSGGGCTETMLEGLCNVGSLDAGINLALVFEQFMNRRLTACEDFDVFYSELIAEFNKTIEYILSRVSEAQRIRSVYLPQPVRTLLIDDCITNELDYNNGGARYSWSIINLAGMINVLDSLLVIRKIVFEDKAMTAAEFLKALKNGNTFRNYPGIPRHGKDNPTANALAKQLSADISATFDGKTPYSGGKFLPSSIQFLTYVDAGKNVGATPDGRQNGDPLCDSIGAIHNNDTEGPTALLNSAASISQSEYIGTPVLNLHINPDMLKDYLKPLIKSYFDKGGMQVQITAVSKEELAKAEKNPDAYPNLIVRVGGYSEYFSRLTPELRRCVCERIFHELS